MDLSNINWKALSDIAILETLGAIIKYHRLEQNMSQSQLATEAGINRSTLIEFEKGKRSNILTFIQILRALILLELLNDFQIQEKISPLQLAKLDQQKRKRASGKKKAANKPKSDW